MKKYQSKALDVEWAYDLKQILKQNFSNRQWAQLSEHVVNQEILRIVDKGLSPVAKQRKYQKYSERYRSEIKSGKYPAKNVSPVNLALTGSMLSHYEARPGENQFEMTVGIHKDAPEDDKVKAKKHNEGTKNIPRRAFVPLAGESYTRKITLEIRKLFAYCLDQALNRRNAK